jgi:membrane protein DedA with SNARE-associated domain
MNSGVVVGLGGFLWVGLVMLVGWVAAKRGQSGFVWSLVALLITPFVAGVILVLVTPRWPPNRSF